MGFPSQEDDHPEPPYEVFVEHLRSKGIQVQGCSCCGRRKFQLGKPIAAPLFANGAIVPGASMPMLPLTCQYCYSVQLFSWPLVKDGAK